MGTTTTLGGRRGKTRAKAVRRDRRRDGARSQESQMGTYRKQLARLSSAGGCGNGWRIKASERSRNATCAMTAFPSPCRVGRRSTALIVVRMAIAESHGM